MRDSAPYESRRTFPVSTLFSWSAIFDRLASDAEVQTQVVRRKVVAISTSGEPEDEIGLEG